MLPLTLLLSFSWTSGGANIGQASFLRWDLWVIIWKGGDKVASNSESSSGRTLITLKEIIPSITFSESLVTDQFVEAALAVNSNGYSGGFI